jgi:hypothetical protein
LSTKIGACARTDEQQMVCGESTRAGQRAGVAASRRLADRAKCGNAATTLAIRLSQVRGIKLITEDWGDQDARLRCSVFGCDDDLHPILLAPVTPTAC